jgi:membrane associated rhomboid family serine protease
MFLFYYLPIGTEVKLRRVPWITLTLILLNTVSFLVFKYDPKGWVLVSAWGLVPNDPSLVNAVMANFLHASWMHLAGNMLYLWLFGSAVEDRIGPVWMLLAYLLGGALSLMAQASFVLAATPQHQAIAILGASGAVSALTGLFLVRFYYVRVRVGIPTMILLGGLRRGSQVYLPALAVVAIWSAIQLVSGTLALIQNQGGTAYAAHVAGLALGLAAGYATGLHHGAKAEKMRLHADRYFRESRWYEAQEAFGRYLAVAPVDVTARLQLGRAHMLTHQESAAAREYARVIHYAASQGLDRALRDAYLEMRRLLPLHGLPLSLQRRVAQVLETAGHFYEAAEAWERFGRLEHMEDKAVPALFHAARLSQTRLGDVDRAAGLFQAVLDRFPASESAGTARARLDRVRPPCQLRA